MPKLNSSKRRVLVVEYDVTGLTGRQIDQLVLEAVVQAESSDEWPDDGHPDVPVIGTSVVDRARTA
jgi:hypothetical protein